MPDLASALRSLADEGGPLDLDEVLDRKAAGGRSRLAAVAGVIVVLGVAVSAIVFASRSGHVTPQRVSTAGGGQPGRSFSCSNRTGRSTCGDPRTDDGSGVVTHVRATPWDFSMAVSPDGTTAYVSTLRTPKPGECQPGVDSVTEIVSISLQTGQVTPVGQGVEPALTNAGDRLAYVRQVDPCRTDLLGQQNLVIRGLRTGKERILRSMGPGEILISFPSWAPDDRHLTAG